MAILQPSLAQTRSLKSFKIIAKDVQRSYAQIQKCHSSTSTALSVDEVLSTTNKENCIKLLNSFTKVVPSGNKSASKKKAAVLVPLCQYDDHLALVYTVRALHLKANGGQIAFPGGMTEKNDRSLETAALREAYEEIGLLPNKVEIWGRGPEIDRPTMTVTPILGYIGRLHLKELKINPNEVSEVFTATLETLISAENFGVTRFRKKNGFILKRPVYLKKTWKIWGLTAYITHVVLSCLVPEIYKKNIQFSPVVKKVIV